MVRRRACRSSLQASVIRNKVGLTNLARHAVLVERQGQLGSMRGRSVRTITSRILATIVLSAAVLTTGAVSAQSPDPDIPMLAGIRTVTHSTFDRIVLGFSVHGHRSVPDSLTSWSATAPARSR